MGAVGEMTREEKLRVKEIVEKGLRYGISETRSLDSKAQL